MAKVSNETRLVISVLKEKAKARKASSCRTAPEDLRFREGIDWALETLASIAAELERGYKL